MKTIFSSAMIILCLSACTIPSPQSRISKNGGMYSLLSAEHRKLVASGKVVEGMSKDAVYLSWGAPSKVFEFEKNGVTKERWVYTRSQPTHTTNIGIGYGGFPRYSRWGYRGCVDYSPHRVYIAEQIAHVVFHRDTVESWERKK